jgi:hypothetical protein
MILRLNQFTNEQALPSKEAETPKTEKAYVGKLKINWEKPDLAQEIEH